jgi:NTE family protein
VFEGGGVKDSAFAGCIKVMDELGLYAPVRNVVGTSGGSITASLLACGACSDGLLESVHHTNYAKFIADKGWMIGDVYRTIAHYGMHTGNGFVKILKKEIMRYAGNGDLTFAQLDRLVDKDPHTYKKLSVVASNLTRQCPRTFNSDNTPELPIWQAVRASVSLPFIFEPAKIGGEYFVDGGLSWVYPLSIFDESKVDPGSGEEIFDPNPHTLGFYFVSGQQHDPDKPFKPENAKIDSLRSYAISIASYLLDTDNRQKLHRNDKERTVFVDDLGISSTNFKLSEKKIDELVESGRKAARAYFE